MEVYVERHVLLPEARGALAALLVVLPSDVVELIGAHLRLWIPMRYLSWCALPERVCASVAETYYDAFAHELVD